MCGAGGFVGEEKREERAKMHCTFGARCSARYWRGYERVRDVGAVACKVVQVEQRPAAGGMSEVCGQVSNGKRTRNHNDS